MVEEVFNLSGGNKGVALRQRKGLRNGKMRTFQIQRMRHLLKSGKGGIPTIWIGQVRNGWKTVKREPAEKKAASLVWGTVAVFLLVYSNDGTGRCGFV